MEIINISQDTGGNFLMDDNGKQIGLMHYLLAGPHKMVIDHTQVDAAYEGKGFGKDLVKAGVDYAREHELKILPLCPFAKRVFDITPAFADVLF